MPTDSMGTFFDARLFVVSEARRQPRLARVACRAVPAFAIYPAPFVAVTLCASLMRLMGLPTLTRMNKKPLSDSIARLIDKHCLKSHFFPRVN